MGDFRASRGGVRLALALLLATTACAEPEPPRVRHAILITVDSLRADHLGSYGSTRGLTPRLDAFAAQSRRFERAYTPIPTTRPAILSLMTGRDPRDHGVLSDADVLSVAGKTVAQRLREVGVRTGAVVSSPVLRGRSGARRGFDHYDQELDVRERVPKTTERRAGATTDAAMRMLERLAGRQGQPFFLWVHYRDPHGPYVPPEALREAALPLERARPDGRLQVDVAQPQFLPPYREVAYYRAGYAGEVRYVDSEIGRLIAGVRVLGLWGQTAIVVTADHGEALGEDGAWFEHDTRLHDATTRVPLLVRVPGLPGAVASTTASLLDVRPTLEALFGLDSPAHLAGRNLLAPRSVSRAPRALVQTTGRHVRPGRTALLKGDYKLVVEGVRRGMSSRLYRLPDEQHDLRASEPALLEALRSELRAYTETWPTPDPEAGR